MDPEEVRLDTKAIEDLLHMFRHVSSIKIAREAFLSMTLCAPFRFHIPKINLHSNADMELIIERHWMPWLRQVYDWVKLIGICPYYFERPAGQKECLRVLLLARCMSILGSLPSADDRPTCIALPPPERAVAAPLRTFRPSKHRRAW